MAIKVQFEIYNSRQTNPIFHSTDIDLARAEWFHLNRKGGDLYRLIQTVTADGTLTKSEEYLYLVYQVRKSWKEYFNRGRNQDVLKESLLLPPKNSVTFYSERCLMRAMPLTLIRKN